MSILRRTYDAVMRAARGPRAVPILAGVSFAESSFFPIPPDVMLIPMMLARPDRLWRLAGICTIASVLGGLLGYAIGYFLFETVGQWVIATYGLAGELDRFKAAYDQWGFWIIMAKGLTPIPFKLVTIASGVARFDLVQFVLACVATRAFRFFLEATLIRLFGAPIQNFIEKYLTWVTLGALVVIVLGFAAIKFL